MGGFDKYLLDSGTDSEMNSLVPGGEEEGGVGKTTKFLVNNLGE